MRERDALKKRSAKETKLHEWLETNRESFSEALGMWADDDTLVLMLVKMQEFVIGRFPLCKDEIDRAWSDVVTQFLRKSDVDLDELRIGVALMAQSFNASVDRIFRLEAELAKIKQQREYRDAIHPRYRPPFPPRRY